MIGYRKRIISMIAAILVTATINGCTNNNLPARTDTESSFEVEQQVLSEGSQKSVPDVEIVTQTPIQQMEKSPVSDYAGNPDKQLDLIADQFWDAVTGKDIDVPGQFAMGIADLNHNNRLEFIVTACRGTGRYSTTFIWEVDESYSSLVPMEGNDFLEADRNADFILYDEFPCYKGGEDQYYYLINNFTSTGWTPKWNLLYEYSFDERIDYSLVGGYFLSEEEDIDKNLVHVWLYDKEGNLIPTEDAFLAYMDDYRRDYEAFSTIHIEWVSFPEKKEYGFSKINESYAKYREEYHVESDQHFENFRQIYGEDFVYQIEADDKNSNHAIFTDD